MGVSEQVSVFVGGEPDPPSPDTSQEVRRVVFCGLQCSTSLCVTFTATRQPCHLVVPALEESLNRLIAIKRKVHWWLTLKEATLR